MTKKMTFSVDDDVAAAIDYVANSQGIPKRASLERLVRSGMVLETGNVATSALFRALVPLFQDLEDSLTDAVEKSAAVAALARSSDVDQLLEAALTCAILSAGFDLGVLKEAHFDAERILSEGGGGR